MTAPSAITKPEGGATTIAATARRVTSLDALRGIAALIVVFYHFSLIAPGVHAGMDAIWPLRMFIAGQTAVYLFFVLSGFVLYLSLQRHDRSDYLTFAIRRLVRLYPPVAVSIMLSAAFFALVGTASIPDLNDWVMRYSWNQPLDLQLLAGHLLLLDTDRFHSLNNPMWSLVVEVRLSLLFPLLAAGIRRWPALTLVASLVVSFLARGICLNGHQVTPIDPFVTLMYLDLFAIGAFMARYAALVSRLIRAVPAPLVAAVTVVALCRHGRFELYFMYAGAILLVAATFTYTQLSRVYGLTPLVWLGRRSYSLYLIHLPLLLAAVYAFGGQAPIGVVLAGAFPLCLLGAELFWRTVEEPCVVLGRYVGRRLSRGLPARIAAPGSPPTG